MGPPGWWNIIELLRNWGAKKTYKEKTRKQNFHGIVPGFLGDFLYVFCLPPKGMTRKNT